ncbi:MAG TPA: PQQ-binding-like beta-propeller repeat protein [Casimicrobiaceae bacterium]|nr:PQQ-binding-like beta-propeller repeat protein [Casimicrobiaceae bacterium]
MKVPLREVMKALFVAVTVAGLLAGGTSEAQSMFRGDAAHAGNYRDSAPRQFHHVKWKFPTGDRIVSSPVYSDGAIYFGSDDGNVYAVDAADGRLRWKHKTGGPVASTPAIVGNTLYVASYDGKFHALDVRTGATRWKFTTGGERRFEARGLHGMQPRSQTFADPYDVYLSSPVVAQGIVYFGSGDGHLYALDAASGELKWKFRTADVVHSSPAYADGTVFFGSWDSYFYALDATTGTERWRFHGGEDPSIHNQVGFQSSPAVVDGVVYTGCRDSNLYALDAKTGKEKWRFNNAGSWVVSAPAIVAGKVIFGTSDSSLYIVLDAVSGKPLVQEKSKAYMFSSPSVAGDVVLTGILNGTLEARDLGTGALLWDFQTEASKRNDGWILAADRTFNTPMYFSSSWNDAGTIAADRQFAIGAVFSSPLVVKGAVYFGSTDGAMYAVE